MSSFDKKILLGLAIAGVLGWGVIALWLCDDVACQVGIVGSIASVLGLGYALLEIVRTRSLAHQTRTAALDAIAELRSNQYRFSVQNASNLLREIRTYIHHRDWKPAAIRLQDLADVCSQLGNQGSDIDDQWRGYGRAARWWATQCRGGKAAAEFDLERWTELYDRLREKIDREFGPFAEEEA